VCLRRLAQNRSSDGIPLLLLCPATTQLICANARANGLIEVAARVLASFNLEIKTLSTSRCEGYFSLISYPEGVDLARAALAEHFGTFTLEPTMQDGEPTYLAHGKIDFFGDEAMARTAGAGGPDSTTRVYPFTLSLAA
jgi:hypothetical protein